MSVVREGSVPILINAKFVVPMFKLPVVVFVSILDVVIPPVKFSNAVAVSGVVFCKYNALACVRDSPVPDVLKKALLYGIPL
jgi:hypothetical protein